MIPGGELGAIIVEQNKQARHAGCHRHRPIYVAGKMKKALYLPCYSQGNTGLSRAAWAGEKTIRCSEFEHRNK
jgi:hypothetical protein